MHVDVPFFRIANRAPSAPKILLLWRPARSLHERTVQNRVSLPDRSRYALSIEVGSCKSYQILRPKVPLHWLDPDAARPLSWGSNSLCWCRIDALDQMVADGRMPRPKRINNCAIWDLHQLDCRISVKIVGRQSRYDHSAGSTTTCAIRSMRLNPGGGMRPQRAFARPPVGQDGPVVNAVIR